MKFKLILITVIVILCSSCGSFKISTINHPPLNVYGVEYSMFNSSNIYLYSNNWRYNNTYNYTQYRPLWLDFPHLCNWNNSYTPFGWNRYLNRYNTQHINCFGYSNFLLNSHLGYYWGINYPYNTYNHFTRSRTYGRREYRSLNTRRQLNTERLIQTRNSPQKNQRVLKNSNIRGNTRNTLLRKPENTQTRRNTSQTNRTFTRPTRVNSRTKKMYRNRKRDN